MDEGRPRRVPTGSVALDDALGGGVPCGMTLLTQGEEGAGAPEFAWTLLHSASHHGMLAEVRVLTALRGPSRVQAEIAHLFQDEKAAKMLDVLPVPDHGAAEACHSAARDLSQGDVLVIESASSLLRRDPGLDLPGLFASLGDVAASTGSLVVMLHASGSLPVATEAGLCEAADGVFTFRWRDAHQTRRRMMALHKLRAIPPALDGDTVPLFEAGVHRGAGFVVSRVKNVM